MAAPYVSHPRLVENSIAAMLAAVEIYNKPQISYRDEMCVILVTNCWELALKAAIRQNRKTIHYRKARNQPYRSFSLDACLTAITEQNLWPPTLDGNTISANIQALSEYRNRSIHLYNTPGLGQILYAFLQQSILNYRDFMFERFHEDLAKSITWQLLPLGATAPPANVGFMQKSDDQATRSEVTEFIDVLREHLDAAAKSGADVTRVAAVYDVNLQSIKALESADLVFAIDPDSEGQIIVRKSDPNQTHPYKRTELLERVNKKRKSRKINGYDHQAITWDNDLKRKPQYAWKHENSADWLWSGDAVSYFAGLSDEYCDDARRRYSAHRKDSTKNRVAD